MSDGIDVTLTRSRELAAPIERVWAWMTDAGTLPLFHVNVFHVAAHTADSCLGVGTRIAVEHRLGLHREARTARLTTCEPWRLGWLETLDAGEDWFPHSQLFELTRLSEQRCRVDDTLRGTFRVRGPRWWLLPWYRLLAPRILAAELRSIARVVEGGAAR